MLVDSDDFFSHHFATSYMEQTMTHVWHPCTQMKDYEKYPPLAIKSAQDCYLTLKDGRQLIDANASWWCKIVGHNDPRLQQALIKQAQQFEHVILADTTNDSIEQLAEKLSTLTPHLHHVQFASDGACAIEIASKLALHAQSIRGQKKRTRFLALQHSYHGETALALSLSDEGRFRAPYEAILLDTPFLNNIPYVNQRHDPLWQNCQAMWPAIEAQLTPLADELCAIIVEPIVQGSGGMRIYSQDFLSKLAAWANVHDIYLIADEIMTGLGRTGKMLACEHANIKPDFICLSKTLTAGYLPLSATLTTDAVYDLFYDDYETGKTFMHSHTQAGNALAVAVANTALDIISQEKLYQRAQTLEIDMLTAMTKVAKKTGVLTNLRAIGGIVAADIIIPHDKKSLRLGYAIYQEAVKRGALLRPLENTLYWLPPLTIKNNTLADLADITEQAIVAGYHNVNSL